ncbi:GNAT family N-acetyltransferase [Floccifex sp.]|uniref:GNAT family N-acetyltransferase n=1 Tax=Floccifex sp. TaxID=2815810 RepID=UPI0029FF2C19|nr:GNAT family N-acetyltransferase [Floccifex sp.]MDD7281235.1 GNAT family N-acetyltransferase [Erysipelotrichaceae bacterium]MDY2958720.1 GNAT family N-acetyltransferase [Floccifex sp.]
MNYQFTLASKNEIQAIFHLYEQRVQWMDNKNIQQWNTTYYLEAYPIDYYYDQQINKCLYVLKNQEKIKGAVCLFENDERWPNQVNAYYIHNLVTDINEKGAGKVILSNIEQMAIQNNKQRLRLDCAIDNKFLNQYYERLGYKIAGTCQEGCYQGNLREKKLGSD